MITPWKVKSKSSNADWYGAEIFRAGLAQQPINPYFVTTTKGKRKADLYIPKETAKDCNLDTTQELLLVDPQGREFPAKCKKWKDGRIVVKGGWRRLCRRNLVAEEDKCICEFVQGRNDGRLVINVSFVRANGHLG
ncbi:hypothetical protein CDL12_00494 [Handroanthus impetiginosus]|uniref:TF-B3 domain-containing protein n=1 Tax=Handroanthus impetiginosus TaxID=429701 RepID=A0A2G9IAJ7_9LAMI|nr:hypothetical protein CDL12_00494 [Handroanthus impetiginosus]